MVRRYRSAGDSASTTLNGAVLIGATSWTVADGSVFPSEGDYYVARGAEIVLVTARSGNVLTVVRGQAGTAADAHDDGGSVTSIWTADELEGRRNEAKRLKTMDYGSIRDTDGNILTASDFTGQGVTTPITIEDGEAGTINCWTPSTHTNEGRVHGATRPMTGGVDKEFTCHLSSMETFDDPVSQARFGMFLRTSAGAGDLYGIHVRPAQKDISVGIQTSGWLNNGFTTTYATFGFWGRNDCWFRIKVAWNYLGAANDQFTYSVSTDGVHWYQLYQHAYASGGGTMGAWCSNGRDDVNTNWDGLTGVRILSWYEESI